MNKEPTEKAVINRAWEINKMLQRLGEKAEELATIINEMGYDYNEDFKQLRDTLHSLYNFDLMDSILNAYPNGKKIYF